MPRVKSRKLAQRSFLEQTAEIAPNPSTIANATTNMNMNRNRNRNRNMNRDRDRDTMPNEQEPEQTEIRNQGSRDTSEGDPSNKPSLGLEPGRVNTRLQV